jgi:hypothetical protein
MQANRASNAHSYYAFNSDSTQISGAVAIALCVYIALETVGVWISVFPRGQRLKLMPVMVCAAGDAACLNASS